MKAPKYIKEEAYHIPMYTTHEANVCNSPQPVGTLAI